MSLVVQRSEANNLIILSQIYIHKSEFHKI